MEKTFEKSQITVCSSCSGKGQQFKTEYFPRHGSDETCGIWETCPTCQGERLVLITETKTIMVQPYFKQILTNG